MPRGLGPAAQRIRGVTSMRSPVPGEPADFDRLDAALDAIAGQKHLLVQWVPHAFGRRSLNVGFCRWIRRRAGAGDGLDLMVHEPGLGFGEGSLTHDAAAAVHRADARPASEPRPPRLDVDPGVGGACSRPGRSAARRSEFCWLPVPSTIPVASSNGALSRLRADALARQDGVILGHFSTYSAGDPRCAARRASRAARQLARDAGRAARSRQRGDGWRAAVRRRRRPCQDPRVR